MPKAGTGEERHGREVLDEASAIASAVDRQMARLVSLVMKCLQRGLAERLDGLPVEHVLGITAGWTTADRRFVVIAAETLADLPQTAAAWFAGWELSWGQVRGIVAAVRHLDQAQRAWVDAALVADPERVAGMGPDQLVDAVTELAEAAREDLVDDRAARGYDRRAVQIQDGLFGVSRLYAEADTASIAEIVEALDSAAHHTAPDIDEGDRNDRHDGDRNGGNGNGDGDGGDGAVRDRRSLGRRRFDGLAHLARTHLAGGPDATGLAKPLIRLIARPGDLHPVTPQEPAPAADPAQTASSVAPEPTDGRRGGAGMPRWAGYGPPRLLDRALGPTRLTRRGMDFYACDATLQPVLVDDHGGLLGVAAPVETIHPDLRAALEVRDLGCRFPGCTQPPARTHAHHIVYRRQHGPTVEENLVLLCAHHHRTVHYRGWHLTLHDDATLVARRGRRVLTSVPAHRQWLPAPDPPKLRRRRDRDAPVGAAAGNRDSPEPSAPPDLPF